MKSDTVVLELIRVKIILQKLIFNKISPLHPFIIELFFTKEAQTSSTNSAVGCSHAGPHCSILPACAFINYGGLHLHVIFIILQFCCTNTKLHINLHPSRPYVKQIFCFRPKRCRASKSKIVLNSQVCYLSPTNGYSF